MLSDIDSVAEELVTADPYDLWEVGKILDYFQKIYEEAKSSELKRINTDFKCIRPSIYKKYKKIIG